MHRDLQDPPTSYRHNTPSYIKLRTLFSTWKLFSKQYRHTSRVLELFPPSDVTVTSLDKYIFCSNTQSEGTHIILVNEKDDSVNARIIFLIDQYEMCSLGLSVEQKIYLSSEVTVTSEGGNSSSTLTSLFPPSDVTVTSLHLSSDVTISSL